MPLVLNTTSNPGDADWTDLDSLVTVPALKTFVYDTSLPADPTNNIFDDIDDFRTALNAAIGPRIAYFNEDVVLTPGVYGDEDVKMMGGNAAPPMLTAGAGVELPARQWENIRVEWGGTTPNTATDLSMRNCFFQLSAPGASPMFQPSGTFTVLLAEGVNFLNLVPFGFGPPFDAGTNDGTLLVYGAKIESGGISGSVGTLSIFSFGMGSDVSSQVNYTGTMNAFTAAGFGAGATVRALPTDFNLPPAADTATGRLYHLVNNSAGAVDIIPSGTDDINGANAAYTLASQYDGVILGCFSGEWITVATT